MDASETSVSQRVGPQGVIMTLVWWETHLCVDVLQQTSGDSSEGKFITVLFTLHTQNEHVFFIVKVFHQKKKEHLIVYLRVTQHALQLC